MDDRHLQQTVEDVWHHHCAELGEALDESVRGLQNLLRLDEYHRSGHEAGQLGQTMGPLGQSSLNLDALSSVLGSTAARCLPQERLQRVNALLAELQELKRRCEAAPQPEMVDIATEEAEIDARAAAHLDRMAGVFRALRIAQLEIRSKYEPSVHDPLFSVFGWRQLGPAELRLCPPFVVTARLGGHTGPVLRKAMSLLESRMPVKVVVLRPSLRRLYPAATEPAVPATMTVETIPLALRGAVFLQTCPAATGHAKQLFEALTSPRPALVSLLAVHDGEDEAAFAARCGRALRARAFPAVSYDPDRARGFVSCFDLSGNPDDADALGFAGFAAGEPEFAHEFSDVPAGTAAENLLPVDQFLELARHQRTGKLPVVYLPGHDGQPRPRVASAAVLTQAADQLHLWQTLKEIAGIDNPHVKNTEAALHAEFGIQQKALIESLQKDMDRALSEREQAAVSATVRKIVTRLTGVDPG